MDMFFMCSTKQGGTSCVDMWKWMCSHGSQFLDCGDMYSVRVFDGIQFLVCEYTVCLDSQHSITEESMAEDLLKTAGNHIPKLGIS